MFFLSNAQFNTLLIDIQNIPGVRNCPYITVLASHGDCHEVSQGISHGTGHVVSHDVNHEVDLVVGLWVSHGAGHEAMVGVNICPTKYETVYICQCWVF